METPSSTIKESEKKEMTKKSALFDITNGSPIVGLATGILKTPSCEGRKCCTTPGSGEALLRGQVKNLLKMVQEEEEVEITSLFGERTNFFHVGVPTPANTPLMDLSTNELLMEDKPVYEGKKKQESVESEMSVTRSLLLDFCDKSESSVDELCEAIDNMNVNGGGQKFSAKFVYNSDDEFVGVEEEFAERIA
ncbi:uncharacterized protein LOC129874043 [Solanum dulcamara]|uniref:uncharacterized protein LOC129874043 n=1 Tax=Solanum dulcamara TaxID=45834 RepID=UPI002486075A|nr:uncharacterized protein LOC129874043 [Solanum dulcamara]